MLSSSVRTPLVTVVLLAVATSTAPVLAQSSARASVSLTGANATLTQGNSTPWTLEKSGSVDSTAGTVTWSISAIEGLTTHGEMAVRGQISVTNTGGVGATIGNVVVNLQTRSGPTWRTRSSDVADATSDDAATRAAVVPSASSENVGSFTENGASASLLFTDASTNSLFALSPKITIAPGATVALRFAAKFDNSVLRLRTGEAVRAEVIVSFGNSGPSGASAPRLDIDGSGTIDPDEYYVRSVPARLGVTVPAETASQAPVLTDTTADVATTGTVSVSNAVFNLGPTTGTVMVNYAPGALGGAITNCAHLRTTDGAIDVQACDTQTIAPTPACTPGTVGCGWKSGAVVTYSQESWGGDPVMSPAAALLVANFMPLYGGGVEIGGSGSAAYSMVFTSAAAVLNYLPSSGSPHALNADLIDPTSTSSGLFGGYVLALRLNVDFADAGHLPTPTGLKIGDLRLCGLSSTPAYPGLTIPDGLTIRQFLVEVSNALGVFQGAYDYNDWAALTADVTTAFESGNVGTFAQQHIVNGACPTPGSNPWKPGDLVTYNQQNWGLINTTASALLLNYFGLLSPNGVEIGVVGSIGNSALFTTLDAVLDYLPTSGAAGPFDSDLLDPTSSSAGVLGGYVLALHFDVAYSDAGVLGGNSSFRFGDLRVCGVSNLPQFNNLTVRQVLAVANQVLGFLITPSEDDYEPLALFIERLTESFESGTPSSFAQQHLVAGACPP